MASRSLRQNKPLMCVSMMAESRALLMKIGAPCLEVANISFLRKEDGHSILQVTVLHVIAVCGDDGVKQAQLYISSLCILQTGTYSTPGRES